jgi:predicted AAA+ superfamily ATPase
LELPIAQDLERKMVFLGGPRQVGKTTLALRLMGRFPGSLYLNWDSRSDRKRMVTGEWPPETRLVVLDEFHKQTGWKSLIKGHWDTRTTEQRILVTGSSRLDVFRRGGDSLMGRYHYWRMHPFTAAEMDDAALPESAPGAPPRLRFDEASRHIDELFHLGGFPEPLLSGDERTLNRWRASRLERLFREDIRSVEAVQQLGKVELLAEMLPARVGSPLSFNSLTADVEASNKTIKSWIDLLARNYYLFLVPPWHRRIDRALKKEPKVYLWDWTEPQSEGARFENMVASHLLKFCHYWQDAQGIKVELHYVRDTEKREVDFLVTWKKVPWMLVECKLSGEGETRALERFGEKLGVKERYLVGLNGGRDFLDKRTGVRVIPAARFLPGLSI